MAHETSLSFTIRTFFSKFTRRFQYVSTALLLHVAYVIGIGITSVVGRMLRIPFLSDIHRHSTWMKHYDSDDLTKMY